jgi:hypothetical protein
MQTTRLKQLIPPWDEIIHPLIVCKSLGTSPVVNDPLHIELPIYVEKPSSRVADLKAQTDERRKGPSLGCRMDSPATNTHVTVPCSNTTPSVRSSLHQKLTCFSGITLSPRTYTNSRLISLPWVHCACRHRINDGLPHRTLPLAAPRFSLACQT